VAIDREKLDLVILVRLSEPKKKPTASELRKPLERYVEAVIPKREFAGLFNERVAALREAGLVEDGGFGLTEDGKARLRQTFGTDTIRWRSAPRYLNAAALGLDPSDKKVRERLGNADGVAAAVLGSRHELDGATTLTAAVDQLSWKLLTGESGKLTLSKARNHLLARELGAPPRGNYDKTARRLAAKELGAGGTDAAKLGASLTETWLQSATPAKEPAPEPAEPEPEPARDGLQDFARRVNETARTVDDGRWGSSKVYISAVWRALAGDPVVESIGLVEFKRRLCEANREGLVALHRADLVGAMDQRELAESEASYLNATFHFVEAPR
jgi:hypothetical protein